MNDEPVEREKMKAKFLRTAPQWLTIALLALLVLPAILGDQTSAVAERSVETVSLDDKESAPESAGEGDSSDLFLVYSVNNVGYIDVCGCKRKKVRQGSLTRRASYIKQARFHHDNLCLLDGGNTLFGPDDGKAKDFEKKQLHEKAKLIVESYNRMGYQAMLVGHHDITMGLEKLREYQKMARFPFLSANMRFKDSNERVFDPTTILDCDGLKVGVVGLTIDTIPEYYLTRANPERPLLLTSALEEAKALIPDLREKCDLLILLSANSTETNRQIASEVAGIDLIVDPFIELGNHKIWIDEELSMEQVGETLLVRTDAQGARLGTLDIDWIENGRPMVSLSYDSAPPAGRSTYWYERASMEPHLLEDPDILTLVEAFRKGASFINTEELPDLPHKGKYLTASTCAMCHVEQTEFWKGTTHADAFASLVETGDQWRQDCIACHVLGYGQAFIAPEDAEPYKDVQCENCHGLNPNHPQDPASHPWGKVTETSCLVCHNKDQTRSDFIFSKERRKVACPPLKRN
ncbi:MAG: multiheme c-type cytochrome [Planctomycetota bacterium]